MSGKATAAAMRAAEALFGPPSDAFDREWLEKRAAVIDRETGLRVVIAALRPIAAAYPDDPGTSDLYGEQPVTITLGDVRRVWRALAKVSA